MFRVDETHHVVDIRSPAEFAAGHIPGATSIPLALLPEALCALPPRDTREPPCVTVYGGDADAVEAARRHVASAKYTVLTYAYGYVVPPALCSTAPSRRLWAPNATLAAHVATIEARLAAAGMPRTALDVACGSGRDAVYLALRGWAHVRAIDTNTRLLACARVLARLESAPPGVLEWAPDDATDYYGHHHGEGSDSSSSSSSGDDHDTRTYALVHVARYLDRRMFVPRDARGAAWPERDRAVLALPDAVAPGGFVVFHTFTEPSTKPRKAKHVLRRGELAQVFGDTLGWHVLVHEELTLGDGRIVQTICAQKPRGDTVEKKEM